MQTQTQQKEEKKIISYKNKVIICGQTEAEEYSYSKPITKNFKIIPKIYNPQKKQTSLEDFQSQEITKNLNNIKSQNRAKTNVRRYIASNTKDFLSFITLTMDAKSTFADTSSFDTKDRAQCNYEYDKFVRKLKRIFPDIKIICVPEYQKDHYYKSDKLKPGGGSIHYHLLINIRLSENNPEQKKWLEKMWGNGFVNIKEVKRTKGFSFYFMKYFSKDTAHITFNKKRFFRSQNLLPPQIIYGNEALLYLEQVAKQLSLSFQTTFENKWIGQAKYKHYFVDEVT
jgi:hypothetical protein